MIHAIAIPAAHAPLSLWSAAAAPVEPPSGRVVAAILQFGDVREPRPDGTRLVRFSPERLDREDMALVLGPERERALDVSLVWDAWRGELLRVLDVAPLRAQAA